MKYAMLGIDLDGTLLDPQGELSDENAAAIQRAHDAGVLVVPCTGRAWNEARRVLQPIAGLREGVFVTGAAINDVQTGRLLADFPLRPELALELVDLLREAPDAVLIFREVSKAGHNYLVTGNGSLNDNTEWWFESTEAEVHHQSNVAIEHMHHTLRVGIAGGHVVLQEAFQNVVDQFGGAVTAHAFEAIQKPNPDDNIHILEIFAPGVDKWAGLLSVAERHGIDEKHIAVIGDEINDVPMLSAAGCGIAMANAVQVARDHADHHTRSNAESGVAYAIDQLLSGNWR